MATFLGEILSARDTASVDEFRDMLSSVEGKLSSLKLELVQALQSCFVATDGDVDRISSRLDELKSLKDDVGKLIKQIGYEKTTLTMSENEIICVNGELDECESNIRILESVVSIVQNLERSEVEMDFRMASRRLKNCESDYLKLETEFPSIEDNGWVRGLKTSINQKIKENYDLALKEWNAKFRFSKNTLTVDPYSSEFKGLVETFQNLKHFTRVWEKFCGQVWQELISRACSPNYSVRVQEPQPGVKINPSKSCQLSETEKPGREQSPETSSVKNPNLFISPTVPGEGSALSSMYIVIKVRQVTEPHTSAEEVFANILILISGFHHMFDGNLNHAIMHDFGEILGAKLVNQLFNTCLKSLILEQSAGDKQKAINDVAQLRTLREKLSELEFTISDESELLLDEFESNFDGLFMNQLREDLLAKIRRLIKSDIHQTAQIRPHEISISENLSSNEIAELHKNPFLQQDYKISISVGDIVDLLIDHFSKYPDDSILVENAFNLYISIVSIPKYEAESPDFIPLTSILIHNNCTFLCHHAEVTFPFCEDKIPLLRTKGSQSFAFMVRSVRTKINSMISSAMTGLDKTSFSNGQSTAKFLAISVELDRLYTIFKDVLPKRVCRSTLATLVDHTVNEMSTKVLSWDDITAACADEVAESFTKFAVAITTIFKNEAPENATSREIEVKISEVVKKWERFRLLAFILTASMKDIEDKWVNGCGPLSQFTADEMRKLVRALFQNTDRRAAFLASIK